MKTLSVAFCTAALFAAVHADSLNVRLVGTIDLPGTAYGIALANSYAYIGAYDAGLRVINVANPASPFETGHWESPDHARGVTASGSYVHIACGYAGLRIIDVSNPAAPVEVGSCALPDYAWGICLSGSYALVAAEDAGLYVIDVSNPAAPVIAGNCDTPGNAMNVVVAGNYAYVADLTGGLRVIDISTPRSPVEVGHYASSQYAYGLAVLDSLVFLGTLGSLLVVNVANPASPFEVGSLARANALVGVAAAGNVVYLGQGSGGLRVVDATNPTAPVEVGFYYQPAPNHVALADGYAYSANTYGLRIFQYYGGAVEEEPNAEVPTPRRRATIVGSVMRMAESSGANSSTLLDAAGRKVVDLRPGPNDLSRLAPGIYFVLSPYATPLTRIIVTR